MFLFKSIRNCMRFCCHSHNRYDYCTTPKCKRNTCIFGSKLNRVSHGTVETNPFLWDGNLRNFTRCSASFTVGTAVCAAVPIRHSPFWFWLAGGGGGYRVSRVWGRLPHRWGCQSIALLIFSPKLHTFEKNWTKMGRDYHPLGSANI